MPKPSPSNPELCLPFIILFLGFLSYSPLAVTEQLPGALFTLYFNKAPPEPYKPPEDKAKAARHDAQVSAATALAAANVSGVCVYVCTCGCLSVCARVYVYVCVCVCR